MENKKIKGATAVDLEGIHFRSKLERSCYVKLREAGFEVSYEPQRCTIWEGKRLEKVISYQPNKRNKREVETTTRPLLPITYTPDFLVISGNLLCYFDAKGFPNDRYSMKKKMFLKYLEEAAIAKSDIRYLFFEVHSVSQILHSIKIIQNMTQLEKIKSLTKELPQKDRELSSKFITTRDFRSLWELVHSCLIRIRRNGLKENPNPKYQELNVEKLQTLEAEVSNYLSQLDPGWLEDLEMEDIETPTDEKY